MRVNINSINIHQTLMDISANNVANSTNQNYTAKNGRIENNLELNVIDTKKATDISKEITEEIKIQNGFDAQIPVIKTENQMLGTILDIKG